MLQNNFPQEHFIELVGLSPFLVGRITLFQQENLFNVEVDIIQSESGKIYNHVKSLYNQDDARDALDMSVQYLKDYLDAKK
ncbi:MAG: hypothetical protein QF441_16065 [Bacteriovoracaceae bacterium]|jgi:hypothetical protein|nr:hypothetical protein [Halobacteriovoraceae bacterium]MDP7322121.1 hypothetical protein [Bacteriovoracaceae bacterium]|tara:strand:- start:105 stop:347 length:243 start_codon:yes stop_codon:yes gene_type:complete